MLNFIIFFANTGTYLLQQKFIHAAFWNAFNVFLYKIILQIHQTCLFYVISKELFGISGILFSTIYFLISLTNFGFDYSLFAFHQYYSSSQKNFKIMMQQFMLRSIAVLFVTSLFLIIFHYTSNIFYQTICTNTTYYHPCFNFHFRKHEKILGTFCSSFFFK